MNKFRRPELAIIIALRILAPIFIFSIALSRGNSPFIDPSIDINFNIRTNWCAGKRARLRYRGDLDYSGLLNRLLRDGRSRSITILLDAGRTYRMNGTTIRLPSGACLIGSSSNIAVLSGGLIMGRSTSKIAITNLAVRDGFGIVLENATDVYLHNVRVSHNIFHGLSAIGSSNIHVSSSLFEGNRLNAIYLQKVTNSVVVNTAIRRNGRDGMGIVQANHGRIRVGNNVTIADSARCGISISSSEPTYNNKKASSFLGGSDVSITRARIETSVHTPGYASLCVHGAGTVRIIDSKLVALLSACYSVANAREFIIDDKVTCNGKETFSDEIASPSLCRRGTIVGNICVPLECGRPGIHGCSRIWSTPACCIDSIAQSRRYCACVKPPCILSNAVELWPLPCLISKRVLV